ncbi:putative oxidoreductase [Rathayibacter sp. PhB152]|uniref:DoxX family protein n=1 Tax=unclassified Rathayibacter TaxID=2609250 RepID=UPI000F4B682E|nr:MULTISPECIES: DoxX family protein [unclassified Rathayibacter]ROQ58580.1 putative oxidoreductase [Rathayibacter sp. PhB152]ROS20858.1 putative oxidoreductase [Rathayibacter sp. PhB127]TDX79504.1 putative oxidoreductase [Rathayibacter sp. PhB151]
MKVGSLVLRLAVGGLFVGHGLQKLRGSFDGPGLDGTEQMMKSLELHPARRNAVAAAVTETAGGAALALGLATPVAAAGLIATMVTAVRKVHWSNGLWNSGGGWEYNGLLAAAATAIVADGPGALSFDGLVGKRKWGAGWALFALVAGAAASTAVIEAGRRAAPAEVEDSGSDTLAAPDSPTASGDTATA